MNGVREEAATRWTPHHGPPRTTAERLSHHVWRHKLLWYISAFGAMTAALAITGLGH